LLKKHRISLTRDARLDLRKTYDYYEGEQQWLGRRFMRHFVDALSAVSERPDSFPKVHRNVRRAIVHRFPYGIFFRPIPGALEVFAVVDLRRDASHWQRRS
jgi:plasmid stabilization system protein ParE